MLDANILIRAVLGSRVRSLLISYGERVAFFAPDTAFAEAAEHLPAIFEKKGISAETARTGLDLLRPLVQSVASDVYAGFEPVARQRLFHRDEEDWPILAAALALKCPIWTEDTDFFGCGVATWTTDRVELYLQSSLL